jgi:hypothetical protein
MVGGGDVRSFSNMSFLKSSPSCWPGGVSQWRRQLRQPCYKRVRSTSFLARSCFSTPLRPFAVRAMRNSASQMRPS